MKKELDDATAVSRVARAFGGYAALGRAIGVDRTTVCHWDRPLGVHNGRGGAIPDRYHGAILAAAARLQVAITREMLVNA